MNYGDGAVYNGEDSCVARLGGITEYTDSAVQNLRGREGAAANVAHEIHRRIAAVPNHIGVGQFEMLRRADQKTRAVDARAVASLMPPARPDPCASVLYDVVSSDHGGESW
jgi:hypothetical protein